VEKTQEQLLLEMQTTWHEMQRHMQEAIEETKKVGESTGETQAAIEKTNGRIDQIEVGLKSRPPVPSPEDTASTGKEQKRAFLKMVRKGWWNMRGDSDRELLKTSDAPEGMQEKANEIRREFKAFSISDDTLGGYFVMPDLITNEIIKTSVLYSPLRALARAITTAANSVKIPVRTNTISAAWTSETGTRAEQTGQAYGMKEIFTHEMYALVLFSRQLLEDAFYDLEGDLKADIAEQMGVLEGNAFVKGDGNGKPWGFLSDTNIEQIANGGSTLTYAGLVKVLHKLKPAYRANATWCFTQDTLSAVRQLVDSQNRPLWTPEMPNGNPATILGRPYVETPDMPEIATNALAVAVGDFGRGYRIVDRAQVTVQRLDELYSVSGQIGLLIHKRVGGQSVLSEAMKILKFA
jgi:HK97 family phage major capsid protein